MKSCQTYPTTSKRGVKNGRRMTMRQHGAAVVTLERAWPHRGGFSYMEIPAVDARQSAVFYEKVLGWNLDPRDTGDPRFADAAGHLIGR